MVVQLPSKIGQACSQKVKGERENNIIQGDQPQFVTRDKICIYSIYVYIYICNICNENAKQGMLHEYLAAHLSQ